MEPSNAKSTWYTNFWYVGIVITILGLLFLFLFVFGSQKANDDKWDKRFSKIEDAIRSS